jgi:tetratricopeptide (TPR) repeat protein
LFRSFIGKVASAAAVLLSSVAAHAAAPGPLEAQSFPIGTKGALCEAQGVRLGSARESLFDRKWAIICRDVARPIGAAYSWRGSDDPQARLAAARATRLDCGEPGGATDALPGTTMRRCRDPETGLDWISYSAKKGAWVHVVEGLAAYDNALRLALANLVEDRIVPGTVEVVTTGASGSLAQARAVAGDTELLIGQGYRHNNAGEYAAAEEYFQPGEVEGKAKTPDERAAVAAQRHEVLVNRALQLSNLGKFDDAARVFGQAEAMGLRDPVQARLLRNFEAIDALNRNRLDEVKQILARPVPGPEQPAQTAGGAVAIDAAISASLNSGLAASLTDAVTQETRLTSIERATILDAQARELSGTVLRLTGQPEQALVALTAARDQIMSVKQGRVLSTARLRAQILSEMALASEALGRTDQAEQSLRDAVALIQLRYPDSASVSDAKARLASFLTRHGKTDEALALYRGIVTSTIGERSALVGMEHQIVPYFQLLVDQLPQRPELVSDLFLASQLIERPGAAQTLSLLSRRLEGGSGQASDLFRRATNVERDLNRVNLELAQVRAQSPQQQASAAGATALADLSAKRDRLQQTQLERVSALSASPAKR